MKQRGIAFGGVRKRTCVYIVCTFPVNVQRWHDQNIFTISNEKYIWFYKFVKLSFIGETIWNEDEKCWKLLIEVVISKQRNKMSIKKWCFCDFSNKNWCFCDFSLLFYWSIPEYINNLCNAIHKLFMYFFALREFIFM